MSTTPIFHLICGGTGAGKSTYARRLATEVNGVRFSIDEWMSTLFGPDAPDPLELAWAMERVERCQTQIAATATQLAATGTAVVLDLSFATARQRQTWAETAARAGAQAQLHLLKVPVDQRWERVARRNHDQGATFHLHIDRATFDFFESVWQEPTDTELLQLHAVHTGAPTTG